MSINISTTLRALLAAVTLATLASCATPRQGPEFDRASSAIRAAENAGAAQHAIGPYMRANEIFQKAETMNANRRSDRAQKLLELATAQANLAKAISEAAQAESSLTYIRAGLPR